MRISCRVTSRAVPSVAMVVNSLSEVEPLRASAGDYGPTSRNASRALALLFFHPGAAAERGAASATRKRANTAATPGTFG